MVERQVRIGQDKGGQHCLIEFLAKVRVTQLTFHQLFGSVLSLSGIHRGRC